MIKKNRESMEGPVVPSNYKFAAFVAITAWVTWLILLLFCAGTDWLMDEKTSLIETAAQVGDAFGPLTSFFSVAAVFTGIVATYIQVKEFRSQLDEMKTSAKEMMKQSETFGLQLEEAKNQTKALKRQRLDDQVSYNTSNLPFFTLNIETLEGDRLFIQISNIGSPVYSLEFECNRRLIKHLAPGLGTATQVLNKQTLPALGNSLQDNQFKRASFGIEVDKNDFVLFLDNQLSTDVTIRYTLTSGLHIFENFVGLRKASVSSIRSKQVHEIERNLAMHIAIRDNKITL